MTQVQQTAEQPGNAIAVPILGTQAAEKGRGPHIDHSLLVTSPFPLNHQSPPTSALQQDQIPRKKTPHLLPSARHRFPHLLPRKGRANPAPRPEPRQIERESPPGGHRAGPLPTLTVASPRITRPPPPPTRFPHSGKQHQGKNKASAGCPSPAPPAPPGASPSPPTPPAAPGLGRGRHVPSCAGRPRSGGGRGGWRPAGSAGAGAAAVSGRAGRSRRPPAPPCAGRLNPLRAAAPAASPRHGRGSTHPPTDRPTHPSIPLPPIPPSLAPSRSPGHRRPPRTKPG